MEDSPVRLSHERLDLYQASKQFLGLAIQLTDGLSKGHKPLADQTRRASLSILLNIAEAAGKPSLAEGRHHFAIARGSALECGAALDGIHVLAPADRDEIERGKALLAGIVSMLSPMCLGAGAGAVT